LLPLVAMPAPAYYRRRYAVESDEGDGTQKAEKHYKDGMAYHQSIAVGEFAATTNGLEALAVMFPDTIRVEAYDGGTSFTELDMEVFCGEDYRLEALVSPR